MAATTNKQRVLNQFFTVLKKAEPPEQEARSVLEHFLYALCYENASRAQADQAFNNLKTNFFDWNEIRVSSVREVEETLGTLSNTENRAQRILSFLQEVFETTFSFDLEMLHKKKGGVKQAAKDLARFEAANDFVVAWIVQHCLEGHSLPLDDQTVRVCNRLGFIEAEEEDRATSQARLEHLVPKAKGKSFTELVKHVANEVCWEQEPNCAQCLMSSTCPTGQTNLAEQGTSRSRSKPR